MIRSARHTSLSFVIVPLLVALLAGSSWHRLAMAQPPQKKPPAVRRAPPKKAEFEDITLTTRDRVSLACTIYTGPESKETVPMILVHDWDGNRGELHPVALWMKRDLKLTVIVPDLRGHGGSLQAAGVEDTIDRDQLRGRVINTMLLDIEACKSHLLKLNNEGKVNIEQLGVLGCGFGAGLALKWAVQDWSVRNLPTYKQGWDVKALILVSPSRSERGLTVSTELKKLPILRNISTLTIVGREDSRAMSDAQRIHKTFDRAWGEEGSKAAIMLPVPTTLQGTELVKAPGTAVPGWMQTFVKRRLVERGELFPWTDRTSPLR